MAEPLDIGVLVLFGIALLWVCGEWAWKSLQQKGTDDDSYYADPATPLARVSPPSSETSRAEDVHAVSGHADRVSAIGDQESSGYVGLKLVTKTNGHRFHAR